MTMLEEIQWAFALRGVVALLIGVVALIWPGTVLSVLVVLFGLYLLADGIVLLWAGARAGGDLRWLLGLQGLAGVLIALVAFIYPQTTIVAAVYLLGGWAIITGILEAIIALRWTSVVPQAGLIGVCGVLSLVLGFLLFRSPDASALVLARLFGAYQVVIGLVLLVLAERLRRSREQVREQVAAS
jgi:uncharacterized membrane protein HdeD (DUF308 family)